jgi:hypothetical protein
MRGGRHSFCLGRLKSPALVVAVVFIFELALIHHGEGGCTSILKKPLTRRRDFIKLGANPDEVHMASRSRKGYWRMSSNSIVQQALSNRRLKEQGVPELSLPCRDSSIYGAKPNRKADEGGNYLDQAALRESCEG